jgi:hypothetical protein
MGLIHFYSELQTSNIFTDLSILVFLKVSNDHYNTSKSQLEILTSFNSEYLFIAHWSYLYTPCCTTTATSLTASVWLISVGKTVQTQHI